MTITLSQATLAPLTRQLTVLSKLLDKGAAFAAANGIDEADLLGSRLAADMAPLLRQVQIASDSAKGGVARLAGQEPPSFADDEVTIAELQARIAKTLDYIRSVPASAIDGSEARAITLKAGPREFQFTGQDFLLTFVLPNFFFHVMTAYALLRHRGVEIGKMDYLGVA